jgi:hypothetical protein
MSAQTYPEARLSATRGRVQLAAPPALYRRPLAHGPPRSTTPHRLTSSRIKPAASASPSSRPSHFSSRFRRTDMYTDEGVSRATSFDYFRSKPRSHVLAHRVQDPSYELNPLWQKTIAGKRWLNGKHLALTVIVGTACAGTFDVDATVSAPGVAAHCAGRPS